MSLPSLPFISGRLDRLLGSTGSTRQRWLGAICLLLAWATLIATAWQAWQLRAALADRQRRTEPSQATPPSRAADVEAVGPALLAAERTRLNHVVRRLNTPWSAIFDALEHESSSTVTVLAVEPDIERGAIRLQTEGRALDDLLRHAGRLQRHPQFATVQLLRIDSSEGGQRLPRLTFDLALAP